MEDDAPPRTDDDWLTSTAGRIKKISKDAGRPRTFYGFYPFVKGFAINPMHTVYPSAYGRRLIGFRSEVNEGKLSQLLLNQLDNRIPFYGQRKPWEFDRKLRLRYIFQQIQADLDPGEADEIIVRDNVT